MTKLRQGKATIDFNCRHPGGKLKHPHGKSRKEAFCPGCQFEYYGPGCLFTPSDSGGTAFGRNSTAKPFRREHAKRGPKPVASTTGGRWKPEHILEVIIEHFKNHHEWPTTTTAFRRSPRLPHSSTVRRHLVSIENAVRLAQEKMERDTEV